MKSGKLTKFNLRAVTAALGSLVVVGGVGIGLDAYAVTSIPVPATATVVTPITILPVADLNFGSFSTTAGGDVTISSIGASRTSTGPFLVPAAPGLRATFTIGGQPNLGYAITLPSTPLTITRSGGAETMTVTAFRGSTTTVTVASASNSFTSTLPGSGTESLFVGATVTAAPAQVPGVYSANYTVVVDYN